MEYISASRVDPPVQKKIGIPMMEIQIFLETSDKDYRSSLSDVPLYKSLVHSAGDSRSQAWGLTRKRIVDEGDSQHHVDRTTIPHSEFVGKDS